MKKHQFVKTDCDCQRRATRYVCKHCGTYEYKSSGEIRKLSLVQAECTHPEAPAIPAAEKFRSRMGGAVDCLAPDYDTYMKDRGQCSHC
jgi:hypothetical protein